METKLLDIACCPLTKLPLQLLDADRLARLNNAIATGQVRRGAPGLRADGTRGEPVPPGDLLREALVSRDGRLVYPVRDGIPILLVEESIDWSQLPDAQPLQRAGG